MTVSVEGPADDTLDVAIVGAGSAGLATAALLQKHGLAPVRGRATTGSTCTRRDSSQGCRACASRAATDAGSAATT